MQAVLAYVRSLLNWHEDDPVVRTSFKRDRNDDDPSSDDESPALKKFKRLTKTSFPAMTTRDVWEKETNHKNVRYVPIEVEKGHPSTSTPNESSRLASRYRTVPIKLVDLSEKLPLTPTRKPRRHTPVRPVLHAVGGDDDNDQEVTFVESKPGNSKRPQIYINVDEDNDQEDDDDDDDVIFVEKVVPPPPPLKPYKYFVSKNSNDAEKSQDDEPVQYYKICKKLNERNLSTGSPKTYSKFKAPAGITKAYKKAPTPIPRWLQGQRTSNLLSNRNRVQSLNGNARTTLSEVFNLDEKKSYQELIKRVTNSMRSAAKRDVINLAEDAAVFRNTQKAQKSAINELKFIDKGISFGKDKDASKEYDPITVASINSSDSEVEIVPSEASTSSSVRIERINTLKDSFRDRDITSNDWLAKLNSKYKKKNLDNQVKVIDAARESDIISKVNYRQNLALLEHKLKHELCIPESLIEEVPPTVEIPKLTPDQEKAVDRALGPGPAGQTLVEKFGLRIQRRDLQTLAGLNWLNDEVINFYMYLLMERCKERDDLPKVYAASTFFYTKLIKSGQAGLRRWTKKVDIFAHDLMVIPIHQGVHWCLSIVDFNEKRISFLDSMGGRNQSCLDNLLQYLRDEHKDKKGTPMDDNGWTTVNLKNIPQQMNGSDCGMFACTFAEYSSRRAAYTFTQANMPQLRRKVACEILEGKLLL